MTTGPIFKDYPYYAVDTLDDIKKTIQQITNIRKDDVTQIGNITSSFIQGRKVGKVPSASNDVAASDRLGDVNWTDAYLYILIDNSGTAEWRRVALGAW